MRVKARCCKSSCVEGDVQRNLQQRRELTPTIVTMPSIIQQTNGYNEVDKSIENNGADRDGNTVDNPTERYDDEDVFQHLAKPQQDVLLLHGPRQKYALEKNAQVPELRSDREILIQVRAGPPAVITRADQFAQVVAIGLNPVDWKGPCVVGMIQSTSA